MSSALSLCFHADSEELENQELSEADYRFIGEFGGTLDRIVGGVDPEGKKTTIVADVHTDPNPPPQVLEEGVGYFDLIVVAFTLPGGRITLGAGLVLSYYEFKQPMDNRLTDEAWEELLGDGEVERPGWIDSFFAPR